MTSVPQLSLIIAPLEEVLKTHHNEDITSNLNIIHKNALSLLNLVNQILISVKLKYKK